MSVTVEITNTANLKRAKALLGTRTDDETLEMALEKVVESHTSVETHQTVADLSDEYWEDLFSDPAISSNAVINAVRAEREDRF